MEPTASPKNRRIEVRLSDEEAARFLGALELPDEGTVARLEDLRRRA